MLWEHDIILREESLCVFELETVSECVCRERIGG